MTGVNKLLAAFLALFTITAVLTSYAFIFPSAIGGTKTVTQTITQREDPITLTRIITQTIAPVTITQTFTQTIVTTTTDTQIARRLPPLPVINGVPQTLDSAITSPPQPELLDYVAKVTGKSYDFVVGVLVSSASPQGQITVGQLLTEVEKASSGE